MKMRAYVLMAIAAFIVAVTGSDLIARMTIAGDSFGDAVGEHLEWASLTLVGILFLFVPFGGTALICGLANKRAKTRSVATIFFIAIAALTFFYFDGFQASQHAMLAESWTAAALSIGLLPFFIGLPFLIVVAIAAAAVAWLDRRQV